jgi:hypothetical protein
VTGQARRHGPQQACPPLLRTIVCSAGLLLEWRRVVHTRAPTPCDDAHHGVTHRTGYPKTSPRKLRLLLKATPSDRPGRRFVVQVVQ